MFVILAFLHFSMVINSNFLKCHVHSSLGTGKKEEAGKTVTLCKEAPGERILKG